MCVFPFTPQLLVPAKHSSVLVWQGMKDKVNELVGVWWEDDNIHELFCRFRRVCKLVLELSLT